jgi:hypothetical protein
LIEQTLAVLSMNTARYSLVADIQDVEFWLSIGGGVCVNSSKGGERRADFPERSQWRLKPRRYWPGVMPVLLRNARVKFA